MPELVATRSLRRRLPDAGHWASVSWREIPVSRSGSGRGTGLACAAIVGSVLGLGGLHLLLSDSVIAPPDPPVWIEMPQEMDEPPAPATVPPPPQAALPVSPLPASAPLEPVPSEQTNPDPSFGLDDAVSTGGLAAPVGTTLAREPDAVVPALALASGPMQVASVPASVRPVVPVYPRRAEELGLEGRVVAMVATDTAGNVVEVIIERSGGREFDESVRRAVLATRFHVPRRSNGGGQAVVFRLPYDFRLE
jgi:protein TonB